MQTGDVQSDKLLSAEIKTMPLSHCNETFVGYNQRINHAAFKEGISNSQYCAYDPANKRDSCRGDSGGPLQVYHNQDTVHIVGIVSFGLGCGTRFPAIYTRVAYYTDWIASHVWPDAH